MSAAKRTSFNLRIRKSIEYANNSEHEARIDKQTVVARRNGVGGVRTNRASDSARKHIGVQARKRNPLNVYLVKSLQTPINCGRAKETAKNFSL